MRNAFASELTALATDDPRIVLLSGDIGNRLFDEYRSVAANRFLNCGVAEANMMSMAAGMALSGLRPVAYTITPFITQRCYEQIRDDVAYHRAAVVLVGTGSGLSYGMLGPTHHSLEDIAMMRILPNMTVVCPGDPLEVRMALRAALSHDGPVYLRLGKKGEPTVHASTPEFAIGRAISLRRGSDVCLVSTGNTLSLAASAAEQAERQGVSCGVVSMHTVKPLDERFLESVFATHRLVVTIEEHTKLGGLGGAVAEWMTEQEPQAARLLRVNTPDRFLHEIGDQEFLRSAVGLTPQSIADRVVRALGPLQRSVPH